MEWGTGIIIRKRHPTDELIDEQPLAKRLSLLHLTNGRFAASLNGYHYNTEKLRSKNQEPRRQRPLPASQEEERMEVDNVVYIDSLESDSESDDTDSKLIFLPDIDRKLTKIPYNLCSDTSSSSPKMEPSMTPTTSTEVVLYSVPTSLTVPEQRDSVRRAILESRARMRQKQAEEAEAQAHAAGMASTGSLQKSPLLDCSMAVVDQMEVEDGVDAMEIE